MGGLIRGEGLMAIARDVRLRSAPVSETDRLFEAIANYTYDWESWLGEDGRPLWINPAVERMTGVGVAECLVMPD